MTSFCVLEVGGQEVFVCIHVLWSFRGSLEFTRVRATTNHYACVRDYIFHAPFCLASANGCKGKKLYKIPLLLSVSFHFMFLFKLLYLAFENYSKYLSCLPIIFIIIFLFNALILLFKPHFAKEQFENFTTKDLGKLLT